MGTRPSHRITKLPDRLVGLIVVWMLLQPGVASAASDATGTDMRATFEWSYHLGPGDTPAVARALALFGAQTAAVQHSSAILAEKGLLKDYGDKRREIYCLAADEVQFSVVGETMSEKKGRYTIRIDTRLTLADFVRAEIRNAALEEEEMHFSWRKEMEPEVSSTIDPATELSRAYRYLRQQHWRMAIIYLDHLERKYPHWGDLFFAKGLGYHYLHETEQAMQALSKGCAYGYPEACERIQDAERVD